MMRHSSLVLAGLIPLAVPAAALAAGDVFLGNTFMVDDHPVKNSTSLRSADMDGDGNLDLVTGVNGGGVKVLLGNGDLTLQEPLEGGGGANRGIELGDFDGDGVLDVVAGGGSSSVSVLLGLGDGTLAPPTSFPTAPGASQPTVADLDEDGVLDLAVPCRETIRVSILKGNGNGTFTALPDVGPTEEGAFTCAIGDTNGDGHVDIVVANQWSSSLTYLTGDGTGAFTGATHEAVGVDVDTAELADMNGDSTPELLYLGGTSVHVREGLGDGSFAPAVLLEVGGAGDELVVADIDEDGVLDVATTGLFGMYAFLGNGDVTFSFAGRWGADAGPRELTLGDFNGNGDLDAVVGAYSVPSVSVLAGHGNGTFGGNHTTGWSPEDVASGDFDEDGRPDLVTVNELDATLSVMLNRGRGTFTQADSYAAPSKAGFVEVADMDSDGHLDVVASQRGGFGGGVWVYPGLGDGTFGVPLVNTSVAVVDGLAIGELDGNPGPDVALVSNSPQVVYVLMNLGDGTLAAPDIHPGGLAPNGVTIGDWDEDGDNDLAVGSWSTWNTVQIFSNNGDGTFAPYTSTPAHGSETWLTSADVNQDGHADLLTTGVWNGMLTVLFGEGDGTFAAPIALGVITNPAMAVAGDFDDDGDMDLAVASEDVLGDDGFLVLFDNLGDGTFGNRTDVRTSSNARGVAAADYDGDGVTDLAVTCTGASNVTTLLSTAGPWAPLGHGLAGIDGIPKQVGEGTLASGEVFRFTLTDATPSTTAFHVVGLGQALAPFKGGTLVPTVDLINDAPVTDATGTTVIEGPWLAGIPSDLTLYFQFLLADAAAPHGFAMSTAISGTTP